MSSNDYWTLDLERLGMQAAVEGLARLILTCQPPYAVCVQGKWGSGKTSLSVGSALSAGKPSALRRRTDLSTLDMSYARR